MLSTMTVDDAIKQGVTVYDYRTQEERAQPLDVSRWQLSPWAKWVAVIDSSGEVWEYEDEPHIAVAMWHWGDGSRAQCIDTINMAGIDWRLTLTAVNVGLHATDARGILQSQEVPAVNVEQQPAQPWCTGCNLPEDICRGHDVPAPASTDATAPAAQISIHAAALPGDVAEALFAQHSASWCQQMIDELLTLLEAAKDAERHARIWDRVTQHLQDDEDMAQLRVAQ